MSNTDRRKKVAGSLVAWPLLNRFSYRPRKSYGFHVYTMGMSLSKRLELAYEFFFFFCNSKRASQVISRNRPMPIVRVNVFFFFFTRDSFRNQITRSMPSAFGRTMYTLLTKIRATRTIRKKNIVPVILILFRIFSNALAYT